jgi:hypothetical protein
MADSDGGVLFPPRARDLRVQEFLIENGVTLGSLGIDQEFKQACGIACGLPQTQIDHLCPNDMWALYKEKAGITGMTDEPFTFPIPGAVVDNLLLESGDSILQEDGTSVYLLE